jgi:hypothetical protein
MNPSDLVSKEAVVRACRELGIRDWTSVSDVVVTPDEAKAILEEVGGEARMLALDDFREGLQVELEHGTRYTKANVTNNHPILTGKIVLAHLKESLLYYKRLAVVELEGDLLKASKEGDSMKVRSIYGRVINARLSLNAAEARFLAAE